MKSFLVFCGGFARRAALFGVVCLASSAHADDPTPKPFPAKHFDKMAAQSPFSPPTAAPVAVVAPAPPPPKIFEKYSVTLLLQEGNEYVAGLNNKDTSEHTRVRTDADNEEGLRLASVEWASDPANTKVTLRKGQEFGVIGFDIAASTAASMPANPMTAIGRPNLRPVPPANLFRPPPGQVPGAVAPALNTTRRAAVIRGGAPQTSLPLPGQPSVNTSNALRPNRPPIPGARTVLPGNDDDDDD